MRRETNDAKLLSKGAANLKPSMGLKIDGKFSSEMFTMTASILRQFKPFDTHIPLAGCPIFGSKCLATFTQRSSASLKDLFETGRATDTAYEGPLCRISQFVLSSSECRLPAQCNAYVGSWLGMLFKVNRSRAHIPRDYITALVRYFLWYVLYYIIN